MKPCVVLQSDFGISTGLPASMTAVISKIDPEVRIYDLCHEVREYDIRQGGKILLSTYPYWPNGTIFVSVVDPGVGTARKSCVAKLDNGSYIVTPDNGTLSYIIDHVVEVREIDETVNRLPGSDNHHTFHGRDVFAYTAARLASGIIDYAGVGPTYDVKDVIVFPKATAKLDNGVCYGEIIDAHDHFGNIGISIPNEMVKEMGVNLGDFVRLQIIKDKENIFDKKMMFHKSFGYVKPGELIMNESSNDHIEISVNQGSFIDIELPELAKAYDLSIYKVIVTPCKEK